MASQVDGPVRNFTAGGAITAFTLVKLSAANTVIENTVGAAPIGVAQKTVATGEEVPVRLMGKDHTCKVEADKAIAVNTAIYAAANGEVSDAASGTTIGFNLEAAAAGDDVIECWLY